MRFNKKANTTLRTILPDVYVPAILFFVAAFVIFTSHKPGLLLPKGLTAYISCLGCLWIGKLTAQHWASRENHVKIIVSATLTSLILSVIIAVFWVKTLNGQAYFSVEILTVFTPLAFFVVLLGFFISVIKDLAVKKNVDLSTRSLKPVIEDFIFIKAEGKNHKIGYEQIVYAEANGNYTKIVTDKTLIKPNMAFSKFEKLLPNTDFIQIHRSFIINKSKITHIEGNRVFLAKHEIPIGNNFKKVFFDVIGLCNK